MQVSPLLDLEGVEGMQAAVTAGSPPVTRPVPSSMRGLTITFELSPHRNQVSSPPVASTGNPVIIHVSFQGFLDVLWVLVTEDATCAPGIIMVNEGLPKQLRARSAYRYNGETPTVESEVLLGLRDHPLTNLVASTTAHAVREFGEMRPLVMCISLVQTAKVLQGTDEKRRLLTALKEAVMTLAQGGGDNI